VQKRWDKRSGFIKRVVAVEKREILRNLLPVGSFELK
jgi:hypothetical protein